MQKYFYTYLTLLTSNAFPHVLPILGAVALSHADDVLASGTRRPSKRWIHDIKDWTGLKTNTAAVTARDKQQQKALVRVFVFLQKMAHNIMALKHLSSHYEFIAVIISPVVLHAMLLIKTIQKFQSLCFWKGFVSGCKIGTQNCSITVKITNN